MLHCEDDVQLYLPHRLLCRYTVQLLITYLLLHNMYQPHFSWSINGKELHKPTPDQISFRWWTFSGHPSESSAAGLLGYSDQIQDCV